MNKGSEQQRDHGRPCFWHFRITIFGLESLFRWLLSIALCIQIRMGKVTERASESIMHSYQSHALGPSLPMLVRDSKMDPQGHFPTRRHEFATTYRPGTCHLLPFQLRLDLAEGVHGDGVDAWAFADQHRHAGAMAEGSAGEGHAAWRFWALKVSTIPKPPLLKRSSTERKRKRKRSSVGETSAELFGRRGWARGMTL